MRWEKTKIPGVNVRYVAGDPLQTKGVSAYMDGTPRIKVFLALILDINSTSL